MTDRLIAIIPKNKREETRVAIVDFKGYPILSVRNWFRGKETGLMLPGESGIGISLQRVHALAEALAEADLIVGAELAEGQL